MTTLPERILSGEVEAPDLFCGGTPCQAFSVAGLRNSLDDARGNLSLTFCEIANAIDHVRSVRSDSPGIIFWENVPGVLSTKDNAFGCFLGALAGEVEALEPPGEKWTNAGCVSGPTRTVAWRVLDAQYFGVAQRRRRVFVVASARDNFDPASVLFEFNGLRRDIAPSREAGKTIAPCVTNGPPFSRTGNERVEAEAMVVQPYEVGNCLTARMHKGMNSTLDEGQTPVIVHGTQDPCVSDIAFAQGRNNGGENVLVQPISNALTASRSSTQCPNEDTTLVPIAIQDVRPIEKMQNGRGWNDDGTAYTVDTHATQGVAQPIPFDTTQITSPANYSKPQAGDPCHPLAAGAHPPAVAQPMAFDGYNQSLSDTCQTIRADKSDGDHVGMVMQSMAVRRLTPVECERLQGFPDNYTNIPWRKKPESPDGPRYKALGNSWAVPVVRWIGKRIQEAAKL
jgi:DNA (cytosine-5)-methyltransferase 1